MDGFLSAGSRLGGWFGCRWFGCRWWSGATPRRVVRSVGLGLDAGDESREQAVELGEVRSLPPLEAARERVAASGDGRVELGAALGGEADALGAAVVGVLAALDQPGALQLGD